MITKEEIKGLSDEEVNSSRLKYGTNKLAEYKKRSFFKGFLSNLSDPIIRVLIGALFINIIFMFPNVNWFESGGIAVSICIATFVSTISEYSSENAFEKLRNKGSGSKALVVRNGKSEEIDPDEIVVGDIIILDSGVRVPADAVIIDGEISVDESALTGESIEVRKSPKNGKANVLRGSLVCSGRAYCKVSSVGENTFYGKVAAELSSDTRPSPLKHRLSQLAKNISVLGYIASAMIAFAYLFNVFAIDSGMRWSEMALKFSDIRFVISKLLNALTLAVSIIVVAVPEGLPMMITVVLSSNMKKMMKDNVLVRKLVGIETSGNINILFTDKTGTLTEGKLKVKELHTGFGKKYGSFTSIKEAPEYKKYLALCAKFCNNAIYDGIKAIGSDATDRAVLEYIGNVAEKATVMDKVPFDSTNKYSSSTVKYDGQKTVLLKGAPEKIINASTTYLDIDGNVCPLDKKTRQSINEKLHLLGSESFRVVALGMKFDSDDTTLENITFIGMMAIRDRIRKEVPSAIKRISEAGVGVVMITGDNADTATSIAKECGIISVSGGRKTVVTGAQLSAMTDEEIGEIIPSLAVVARALPSDKSRLVRIAQQKGLTVGMTGDGINDASSLKMADVGFAMGSGTDVAKEACDIIISDNNFASIVKAVLYGRTIFESIRKFIVFQLTMNLGAVGISLIGPFIGIENPVTITQMLWVNIIMDTLGALAFACEPADEMYMKQKPKTRDEKLISSEMMHQIIGTGLYILGVCVWFLKSGVLRDIFNSSSERYLLSAFFAMFIFMGVFVCFTSRTPRVNIMAKLSKNRSFIIIMLAISVMQMAFIYFGGDTFRATPLYPKDLILVIFISFTVVIFDFLRKIIYRYSKIKNKRKRSNIIERKSV